MRHNGAEKAGGLAGGGSGKIDHDEIKFVDIQMDGIRFEFIFGQWGESELTSPAIQIGEQASGGTGKRGDGKVGFAGVAFD